MPGLLIAMVGLLSTLLPFPKSLSAQFKIYGRRYALYVMHMFEMRDKILDKKNFHELTYSLAWWKVVSLVIRL